MRLNLDFGPEIGIHGVDLEHVTDSDHEAIKDFLVSRINDRSQKSRVAIADTFLFAIKRCPLANISDLWHHILYRTYIDHKTGTNPGQSWVRTSGEAYEIALVDRYNPLLDQIGMRLTSLISGKQKAGGLARLGIEGLVGTSKVDLLIEQRRKGREIVDGYGAIGGIHAKVSLAERMSDDIPASRIMMEKGLLSVLCTLDVKSFPPPHGDLVNRGELGTFDRPSDKRSYIESHGDFSCCFSHNRRSAPSPKQTPSGKRIYCAELTGKEDSFVRFLEENSL